jgi:microcystin-dependent protein
MEEEGMSDPYLGAIYMFAGSFAPLGYAFCDGQILSIQQNTALFSLLGVNYGGNGTTTFGLPNLQGASPLSFGQGAGLTPRSLGETGGTTAVTLLSSELPSHTHAAQGVAAAGTQQAPGSSDTWAEIRGLPYAPAPDGVMDPRAISLAGGNQPHNNMPPYQVINFIIALQGIYPSRS